MVPRAALPSSMAPERYYVALGQACDAIVRCKDCKRLITYAEIQRVHACPRCGNSRVSEVTTLRWWEWLKIRLGILDFPYRRLFLAEFKRT